MYSINSIQNYDELPNFNPNENVLELMREITKAFKYDYDCTIKIKAITDFRRLRKFHNKGKSKCIFHCFLIYQLILREYH